MQKPRFNEMTDEELRRIEATWKSDIEMRIDKLQESADRIERAFQQAQGALVLVKWGAAICATVAAAAVWISQHIHWKA